MSNYKTRMQKIDYQIKEEEKVLGDILKLLKHPVCTLGADSS